MEKNETAIGIEPPSLKQSQMPATKKTTTAPPAEAAISAENQSANEATVRRRYATRLAQAFTDKLAKVASAPGCDRIAHGITELTEKPYARPYVLKLKSGVAQIVETIDETVDGVVDQGSVLWISSQERFGAETIREAIAQQWGVTTGWIDERFDIYIEISENFVNKWFPSGSESNIAAADNSDNASKSRQERLMAVPLKVRGGIQTYAQTYAGKVQSGTQQLIEKVKESPYSVFLIPKMNVPSNVVGRYYEQMFGYYEQMFGYFTQYRSYLMNIFQEVTQPDSPLMSRIFAFSSMTMSFVSDKAKHIISLIPPRFGQMREALTQSAVYRMLTLEGAKAGVVEETTAATNDEQKRKSKIT